MVSLFAVVHGIHLVSTIFMTGLIWFVQVVHYPLKASVGPTAFRSYQQEHLRRTTWVVAPPMVLEALSAAALVGLAGEETARNVALFGLVLLAAIWVSTAVFQVPNHHVLERQGFEPVAHRRLVQTNWIRTVAWSLRTVVACWLFVEMASI